MSEKVKDIFTSDEWLVLTEFAKGASENVQDLPVGLNVDKERMGEFIDE